MIKPPPIPYKEDLRVKWEKLNGLEFSFDAHLHKLQGDRAGRYTISINPQYLICFTEKKQSVLK